MGFQPITNQEMLENIRGGKVSNVRRLVCSMAKKKTNKQTVWYYK